MGCTGCFRLLQKSIVWATHGGIYTSQIQRLGQYGMGVLSKGERVRLPPSRRVKFWAGYTEALHPCGCRGATPSLPVFLSLQILLKDTFGQSSYSMVWLVFVVVWLGFFWFFKSRFLCMVMAVLELALYTRLVSNSKIDLPPEC